MKSFREQRESAGKRARAGEIEQKARAAEREDKRAGERKTQGRRAEKQKQSWGETFFVTCFCGILKKEAKNGSKTGPPYGTSFRREGTVTQLQFTETTGLEGRRGRRVCHDNKYLLLNSKF